ncbi:MAG: hypothetical protein JJ959_06365 [Nisaea sp.]|uniref:hypothetical protein n=1 Tax=Nisaea sp. TaxID=2024842 RepID=UPI001B14B862|nr:hypothetical protein [Nisaea sp.]MBO6560141.1 hypothetical protein [Nisaea sp.]
MARWFSILITSLIFTLSNSAFANDEKIKQAINVVKSLCLAGQQYDIEADIEGNIRFKSFVPGGEGSFSINVREASGATAIKTEKLRLIADREVRECTRNQISRIVDAIFSENPPSESSQTAKNHSIRSAKFIGHLPGELLAIGQLEKLDRQYFRFSASEPIIIDIDSIDTENRIDAQLSSKNTIIHENGSIEKKERIFNGVKLLPGDYYLSIKPSSNYLAYFEIRISGYRH